MAVQRVRWPGWRSFAQQQQHSTAQQQLAIAHIV
jgi:hypothetical protein